MTIIDSAKLLQEKGIGSMSPNTLIRYHEIYQKFQFYKRFEPTTRAVVTTAKFGFCSEELVWLIIRLVNEKGLFG
jgi:hypothetical protein